MFKPPAPYRSAAPEASSLSHLDAETLHRMADYFEATAASIRAWAATAKARQRQSLLGRTAKHERRQWLLAIAAEISAGRIDPPTAAQIHGLTLQEIETAMLLYRRQARPRLARKQRSRRPAP